MPVTAQQVIDEARYEDASFTENRHTAHVLRTALGGYQTSLVGRIAWAAPEELSVPYDVPLPLENFDDGHLLTEAGPGEPPQSIPLRYIRILNVGEAHQGMSKLEFRIGLQAARWDSHRTPAGWLRHGRLFLVGEAGAWRGISLVRLFYVPTPAATLESVSELVIGDLAHRAYVTWLAWRMAQRAPKEAGRHPSTFHAEHVEAEEQLMRDLLQRHDRSGRIREVW